MGIPSRLCRGFSLNLLSLSLFCQPPFFFLKGNRSSRFLRQSCGFLGGSVRMFLRDPCGISVPSCLASVPMPVCDLCGVYYPQLPGLYLPNRPQHGMGDDSSASVLPTSGS